MIQAIRRTVLGIAIGSLAPLAIGDEVRERHSPFIATIQSQLQGIAIDPNRCPDAATPYRIDVAGAARTTRGAALYVQSHCENEAHTIFTDGTMTLTFADGAQLRSLVQGRILSTPSMPSDATLMIAGGYRHAGGSGAFSRARGSGVYAGSINLADFTVTVVMSGAES